MTKYWSQAGQAASIGGHGKAGPCFRLVGAGWEKAGRQMGAGERKWIQARVV